MVPRSDVPRDKLVRGKQSVELWHGLGAAEFLESATLGREPQQGSRILAESYTQHGCHSELRRSTEWLLIVTGDLKALITTHSLPSDVQSFTIRLIVVHSLLFTNFKPTTYNRHRTTRVNFKKGWKTKSLHFYKNYITWFNLILNNSKSSLQKMNQLLTTTIFSTISCKIWI